MNPIDALRFKTQVLNKQPYAACNMSDFTSRKGVCWFAVVDSDGNQDMHNAICSRKIPHWACGIHRDKYGIWSWVKK